MRDQHLREIADRLDAHSRAAVTIDPVAMQHQQDCADAAQGIRDLIRQRANGLSRAIESY